MRLQPICRRPLQCALGPPDDASLPSVEDNHYASLPSVGDCDNVSLPFELGVDSPVVSLPTESDAEYDADDVDALDLHGILKDLHIAIQHTGPAGVRCWWPACWQPAMLKFKGHAQMR